MKCASTANRNMDTVPLGQVDLATFCRVAKTLTHLISEKYQFIAENVLFLSLHEVNVRFRLTIKTLDTSLQIAVTEFKFYMFLANQV